MLLVILLTVSGKYTLFYSDLQQLNLYQDICKTTYFISGGFADTIGPREGYTNIIRKERESVALSCTFETDSNYIWLYWYRQYPNKEPEHLLYKGARSWSGDGDIRDGFQSTTSQSSTQLIIISVTLSDSALYYCALRVGAQ